MLRVLFDTNVLLDVLLVRHPFFDAASYLVDQVDRGRLMGLLGATTVTTIFYVGERQAGAQTARRHIERLLSRFDVAPVGRAVLEDALQLGLADYEDAVLHEAGRRAGASAIVTRNEKDFAGVALPVYRPEELVLLLRAQPPQTGSP